MFALAYDKEKEKYQLENSRPKMIVIKKSVLT